MRRPTRLQRSPWRLASTTRALTLEAQPTAPAQHRVATQPLAPTLQTPRNPPQLQGHVGMPETDAGAGGGTGGDERVVPCSPAGSARCRLCALRHSAVWMRHALTVSICVVTNSLACRTSSTAEQGRAFARGVQYQLAHSAHDSADYCCPAVISALGDTARIDHVQPVRLCWRTVQRMVCGSAPAGVHTTRRCSTLWFPHVVSSCCALMFCVLALLQIICMR